MESEVIRFFRAELHLGCVEEAQERRLAGVPISDNYDSRHRQLRRQESSRPLPRKLGCRAIIRVGSVVLEEPVRRPRVCVEREVRYPCAEVLLEISHGGRGFKFVRLSEMTEEGRLDVGIVSIPRPIEEDDRSDIRWELLRQPKTPECPHGKADDSEVFSLYRLMAL